MSKYRSLKAFQNYENRSKTLDPFRIVALLKKHPQGLRKFNISLQLESDLKSVEDAVWILQNKGLVTVGKDNDRDLVILE